MQDDSRAIMYEIYTADCLGMIARQLYGSSELPLYTDVVEVVKKPVERPEDVKRKILDLLK